MSDVSMDKILEREDAYRQGQLDALNWRPIGKAPFATGPGVLGYSFETHLFMPRFAYRERLEDPAKMLAVEVQKAEFMRHHCLGRVPNLHLPIRNPTERMMGAPWRLGGEGLWDEL